MNIQKNDLSKNPIKGRPSMSADQLEALKTLIQENSTLCYADIDISENGAISAHLIGESDNVENMVKYLCEAAYYEEDNES